MSSNTLSKILGSYMSFLTPSGMTLTSNKPLDIEETLFNLKNALEEYKEKDDLVALTVKECFDKLPGGARIQKLKMVVFAAICKKRPDPSGEETQAYLGHIEEYLKRNTSTNGTSLLGCKNGGSFLWANEPKDA